MKTNQCTAQFLQLVYHAVWATTFLTFMPFLGATDKPPRGPEVLVVGDIPLDLPVSLRPEPGRQVYYVFLGLVERYLGSVVAGEEAPDPVVVERELERVLASQGFVRTGVGGPQPSIALVVTWGSSNHRYAPVISSGAAGGPSNDGAWPMLHPTSYVAVADLPQPLHRRDEIAWLVGSDKLDRRFFTRLEESAFNDAEQQDRLYLLVAAFDAPELANKQKKLLWRTRISLEARGHTLPETLTVMLASAAPYFGSDTPKPLLVDDAARRRRTEVIIGPMEILPMKEK